METREILAFPNRRTPAISDNDPEVKKKLQAFPTTSCSEVTVEEIIGRYSSWEKLKRVVAWLLRYRRNLRKVIRHPASMPEKPEIRPLNLEELRLAETEILKYVQCRNFQTELARVKKSNGHDAQGDKFSKQSVGKTSPLYKLDPVLKNQLLRVGGRLANAPISEESKHPIIVPKHSPISCLIARDYHRLAGHSGLEHVLSMIRERFWIVGARNVLKKMLNSCVDCKRRQAPAGGQKMADLPGHRVTPDKPPFTFAALDHLSYKEREVLKSVMASCLLVWQSEQFILK